MILEQLTLRNFCLFRGKQVLNLSPARPNGRHRPIILFGGINGGGKTTLFDAIQLALYGSRARCSKRANLSYEEFLRQSIHHGIAPEEGAGVALSFQYVTDGEPHDYEVRRDWRLETGKVRESLMVLRDELPDYSLARSWAQVIEELIPIEIAQLFFFDGEKIRQLAEDATSSAALGSAIKSLLGLDIVERLIGDAAVLETRLLQKAGSPQQRAEAEALETQYREVRARLDGLQADRAALENRRLRAQEEAREAEEAFAAAGGRHWDERQARGARLAELKILGRELHGQLLALAAGELPLALVPDLLAAVEQQAGREQAGAEAEVAGRILRERDEGLLAVLSSARAPQRFLDMVRSYLAQDRESRRPAEPVAPRLGLAEGALAALRQLRQQKLPELVATARRLLEQLAGVEEEREALERLLAATPEEIDIGAVMQRFKEATQTSTQLDARAEQLKEAIDAEGRLLKDAEAKLRRLWEGRTRDEFAREDSTRMAQLADRTRATMQEFLRQATGRKIDRLSALITESFRFLARKQSLVERILIDPETFAVTLFDAAEHALPRQRLSEGEKQIFAIALLWGLARASARPLPAVIDTPMARLDAAHRQHLVERYFPNASHQVVILSTDTEVDRHYYQALRPAVARAYHLRYDDAEKMTVAEEGYFWKD